MALHITSCEHASDNDKIDRMSAAEFLELLPQIADAVYWFADYTGANVRTVRRWADGSQDIPVWVPRFLALHKRLMEGLAWSTQHDEQSLDEVAWQDAAARALWAKDEAMLAARAKQREARKASPPAC